MNVSSIVVKTDQEHLQEVMDNINEIDLCEVHIFDSEGKIVVTIEGKNIDDQMERMKKIQKIPFVHGADLSYSYTEDETLAGLEQIKNSCDVPEGLK